VIRERDSSEMPEPHAPTGWLQRLVGLLRYNS
jgi:hypothetical protein